MGIRLLKILIYFWLVIPAPMALAQLTLGAAPGVTSGLKNAAEVHRLAKTLADALGEPVVVRLFDNRDQIGLWLNQHAMLDLGVFDSAYLAAHPGEFLVLGAAEKSGRLVVVTRQGATGDMPKRVAAALRHGGKATPLPRLPEVQASKSPPAVTAEVHPAVKEVPAGISSDQLVLGLVTSPTGTVYTQAEADQLAALLGDRLGVPILARLFDSEQTLSEWFLRFRMIDLAMIAATDRGDLLGRNYQPLLRLTSAAAVAGAPALVVARLDLPAERLAKLVESATVLGMTLDLAPALTLSKSATVPSYKAAGDEIGYRYEIKNTGNVTLTGITVSDAPVTVSCPATSLAPGAALTCAGQYPVTAADLDRGSVATTATATSQQTQPVTATVTVAAVQSPALTLSKTATVPLYQAAGDEIGYRYEIKNTGNVTLTGITLSDAPVTVSCPATSLAPGAVLSCTGQYPVTAADLDRGSVATPATATSQQTQPVTATATVAAQVIVPAAIGPIDIAEPPAPVAPTVIAAPKLPLAPVVPQPVAVKPSQVAAALKEPAKKSAETIELAKEPTPPVVESSVQPVPEVAGELPFIPVPPRVIEEPLQPVRVDKGVTAAPEVGPGRIAEPPILTETSERPEPVGVNSPSPSSSRPAVPETLPSAEVPFALTTPSPVPDIISQPDLPQELRPPGLPLPRPSRLPKATPPPEEPVLLAKFPEPMARTPKPPPLLPEPDPEPGVVYVAPFITLMVPPEVEERIFDQFIDTLNELGAARMLKFVILKQGLDKTDRAWLGARKHAVGEIYGYVEESGCCSTDIRTRVRLTYYRAHQDEPVLKYEYPARVFFEHERSTLAVERHKLADQIAGVLVEELFKALEP